MHAILVEKLLQVINYNVNNKNIYTKLKVSNFK
jgi:hypothetical protein